MLDGVNIVKDPSYKLQSRVGQALSRALIPFIYRLDKIMFQLQDEIEQAISTESLAEQTHLSASYQSKFDVLNRVKPILKVKGPFMPKHLMAAIDLINSDLITVGGNNFEFIPDSREDLFYLFKWLFQEVMLILSSPQHFRNSELTKYLNQTILSKNKALMHFIRIKHQVPLNEADKLNGDKTMERLIMLLQEDDDICLDSLVNEQLLEFYNL